MSAYYPAVMAQVDFACSVLGFIKRLLRAVLPALARDRSILGTKEQFRAQIDAAFAALNPHEATEADYRLAVANAACLEVSNLCGILTDACECAQFDSIARRYLNPQKFVRLVLKQDAAKLDALFKLVREGDGNLGRLLMRVGAILEGRPDTYDEMDAAAKRKATVDTKKIIAEVKTIAADMSRKIDEGKAEIVEHVDAVGAKVDKLKFRSGWDKAFSRLVGIVRSAVWMDLDIVETLRLYGMASPPLDGLARTTFSSVWRAFERPAPNPVG